MRTISALVDERHGLLALARRPRGAPGHGDEEVRARPVQRRRAARRSRRRASRPSTTAAGASAAPGSSCGCPDEEYPRRGSGLVIAGLVVRPRGDRGARGRVPLAPRRARGHRRLRADGARRAARGRVIRALISDFGGVLTTPLSARLPRLPGGGAASRSRTSAARMQGAAEAHGEHPLYALERGEISEQRVRAPPRARASRRLRPRRACASSTSSASSRTRR